LKTTDLEKRLTQVFREDFRTVPSELKQQARAFLGPLKHKSPSSRVHYEHCIRVGLLVNDITSRWELPQGSPRCWDAFVAGLLHDVGKALIDPEVLKRSNSGEFTQADRGEMHKHPLYGYELVRGSLGFTADIIARHHRFQGNSYPDPVPPYTENWPEEIRQYIEEIAGIVSLADSYDAMHRAHSRYGDDRLTGEEIKQMLLGQKSTWRDFIEQLYAEGIFSLDAANTA